MYFQSPEEFCSVVQIIVYTHDRDKN